MKKLPSILITLALAFTSPLLRAAELSGTTLNDQY